MADEKPKTLPQLAALTFGATLEDAADPGLSLNFDDDTTGLKVGKDKGAMFKNGDYNLKGHEAMQKGAEILGQQLIDKAEQLGMKITDLKEFKDADFNRDGKVTAKEVGAMLLAADMGAILSPQGEVESRFHNRIGQGPMQELLGEDTAKMAKEIAKQLLQDNGMKIPDGKTDQQFVQTMRGDPNIPRQRC